MKQRYYIYLLPNLLTTAALCCGFFSVVSALQFRFETAAIALFIAIFLDGADGRVVRLVHAESNFGAQYDSLSDVVSFGLAPALLVYQYSLFSVKAWGWLLAFAYLAATALRLARFNVQHGTDSRFFQGLPSPVAAALIASMVWVDDRYSLLTGASLIAVIAAVTVITALLMVSNIRFYSFKKLDLTKPKKQILCAILILFIALSVLATAAPALVLLSVTSAYVCSGIFIALIGLAR